MYLLKSILIENIGLFSAPTEIPIPARPFVALVGPNGAGKTTILECIAAAAYFHLDRYAREPRKWYYDRLAMRKRSEGEARLTLHMDDEQVVLPLSTLGVKPKPGKPPGKATVLVRYYPITRSLPPGSVAGPKSVNIHRQSLDLPGSFLKQWLVNVDYDRKSDIAAAVLQEGLFRSAIETLTKTLTNHPTLYYKGITRRDGTYEPEFETDTGIVSMEVLAAGAQSLLAIFGDLIMQLSYAFPDSENPLAERALVLIDELELHLHPAWQQTVAGALQTLFPNTQFIVSTHSPLIVNDCAADSLLFCHVNACCQVEIMPSNQSKEGWLAEDIYTSVFRMGSSRNPHVEELLEEYYKKYVAITHLEVEGRMDEAQALESQLRVMENRIAAMLPKNDPGLQLKRFKALEDATREDTDG